MIITHGVWLMIFKRNIFVFLSCFSICSCGLQIGEVAPGVPDYYLPESSTVCSQLDYKKVFLDYFFANKPSGQKVDQALACISIKIKELRSLISHEFLNKQQTVNILNQDFIQKSNMKKLVDNILNPEYFSNYISIKNSLVYLVQPSSERGDLNSDWICQMTAPNDENIVSKRSADILIHFLEDLSEFFSSSEKDAYVIFENFFSKRSISKSDLQTSQQALNEFSSFLADYLSKKFPPYSQFLIDQIEKDKIIFLGKTAPSTIHPRSVRRKRNSEAFIKTALTPVLETLNLPVSKKTEITPQNLKYIMLNIYIMQAFFKVYDLDQDFKLSPQELKSLSCLMTPLVSVIVSSELKEQWEIIQRAYDPTAISNYIINYQELPSRFVSDSNFWKFVWFRINDSDELRSLSYIEVSQLISLLLLEFFNKIQFEKL